MFKTAILFLVVCLGSTCTAVINVNEIRDRLPIPAVADDILTFRCTMDMSFFQSTFDFRGFLSSSYSKRSLRYCGHNAFKVAPPVSGTTVDLTSLTNCSLTLRLTVLGSKLADRAADVQVDIVWTAQVNYTQVQSLAFVMPNGIAHVDLYYMRWPSLRIIRHGRPSLVYDTAGTHVQLSCNLQHALEVYASSLELSLRWSVPDGQPPARNAISSISTADDVSCRADTLTNCSSQISLDLLGSQTVNVTCTYEVTLIGDDSRASANPHASKTFSHTVALLPDFALRLDVSPARSLGPVTPSGAITLGEQENVTALCQLRYNTQFALAAAAVAAPHVVACTRDNCFVLPSDSTTTSESSLVETRANLNASFAQHSLINVSCVTTQRSEIATLNVVSIGTRPTRAILLIGSASTFEASCAFRSEVQFEAHSVQFALADLRQRVTIAATRVSARSNASPHQFVSGTFSLRDLHDDAAWAAIWERMVRASIAEPVLRLTCTIFHPDVLAGGERVALATSELASVRFGLRAPRLVQNGATRDGQYVARISSGSELASAWTCRWDCDGWCPPGATLRLCVGGETNVYCDESQPGRTLVTLACNTACANRVDKLLQAEAALELRCTVAYDRLAESALRASANVQLKAARRLTPIAVSSSVVSSKSSINSSVAAAVGGRPGPAAVSEGDVHIVIVSVAVGCLVTMLIAAFVVYAVIVRRSSASRKRAAHVPRSRLPDAESRRMISASRGEPAGPLGQAMRYSCSLTESHPPHLLVARVDQRACCDAPETSLLCRCTCQSPAAATLASSPEVKPDDCRTRTPSPPPPDLLTLASGDSPWRRLEFCEWQRSNQPRNEQVGVLEQLNGPPSECLSVALPQTQLTASGILSELLARHEHGVMHYKPHADLV